MSADEALRAGKSAEDAGDFVGAAAAFGSLLAAPEPRLAAQARFNLARVVWRQGNLDKALELCQSTRVLATQLGDDDLRAQVENAIGVLHVARGEYAQASAAYAVALDLTQDAAIRAKIQLNLGVIANVQGKYDLARRHYAQSLAMCREAGDTAGEALALHNIGMLHADRAEWDEAEEAFRGALALFEARGNRQMIGNVLINRSEVSYGRGRTHDGIAQCDMALRIYAEVGDEIGRGEALRWKGHGLRLIGRSEEAGRALSEALRVAGHTHARLLEAEATRELATLRRPEDAVEALRLYERALELFTELGAQREIDELREELKNSSV